MTQMEGQLDFLNLDEELEVAIPEDSKVLFCLFFVGLCRILTLEG